MDLNAEGFSETDRATLKELVRLFGEDVLLVGGAALRALYGMNWRTTDDVDVYVAQQGGAAAERLGAAGWEANADGKLAHRWSSPAGSTVDIVPAGKPPGADGPQSARLGGPLLNVVGSGAGFRDRRSLPLGNGCVIGVAGPAGLMVMKASAFLDAPSVRPHDLQDVAWLLHRHADDDDRRFQDDVLASGVDFDDAGAFVLGRDVAELADTPERMRVRAWIEFVTEPGRQRLSIMGSKAPGLRMGDDAADWARAKLAAFAIGFEFGR